MAGLSKNQRRIIEMLEIKPEMTTKEIAEMLFGKTVMYKSKEYASVYRSLASIEKQGIIKRVQVQLRWRIQQKPDLSGFKKREKTTPQIRNATGR